ncbi:hypothetical protein H0H93_002821, partial [Arthromyces matolae]
PADKEIAYAGIRNEIAALQASIRACKRRHNNLNITARLPDEILADIFHWNSIIDREAVRKDFTKTIKRSWFRVSFVSSEWRRVAVNCAALWTIHDYKESGKWLSKIILPRSKNSSLSIQIKACENREHNQRCEAAQIMLRNHSQRICNLGLWGHCSKVIDLISQKTIILPHLENLDVGACRILADVLQHMAPTLKALSLYHSNLHLQPHLPLSLPIKSLTLVSVSIESFTHLVALLKACEKVQQLTFDTILLSREEDPEAPIEPSVVLPNLKRLTIMGKSCTERHMAEILSTISFPVLTRIKICTQAFEISSELLRATTRFIHPVKFLSVTSDLSFSLSGISPLSRSGQWSIPQNHLKLSIQGSAHETIVRTFYRKLSDTFTLDGLEILEISTQFALISLREVIGELPSVHTLNIFGGVLLPICSNPQFFHWYGYVKELWLKPQVADIDVQDKELSKLQAALLRTLVTPPRFSGLKRLEIPYMGDMEAYVFGAFLLFRHTIGKTLQEAHIYRIDNSADVRDLAIIRQCVEYLHVGSMPQQQEVGQT